MNDKKKATPASFEGIVAQLGPLLEELQSGPTHQGRTLRKLPQKGVYVFYEDVKPMYVGRVGSNSKQTVRQRIRQHTIPSSVHNQATFAFRLLQEDLGLPVGHESDITRPELADNASIVVRQGRRTQEEARWGCLRGSPRHVSTPGGGHIFLGAGQDGYIAGLTPYRRLGSH